MGIGSVLCYAEWKWKWLETKAKGGLIPVFSACEYERGGRVSFFLLSYTLHLLAY